MSPLIAALVVALDFGISWFNAYSVGRSWADSKAIGGWPRFMVWCAAIMSACGFSWCYLFFVALVGQAAGWFPPQVADIATELVYVAIILPVLGSGIAIWMDSVTTAWRRRDVLSIAVAGYNTYAMAHNTYEAATTLPGVFKDIGKLFSGDDDGVQGKLLLVAILVAIIVLCAGIFTTVAIVRNTARDYSAKVVAEHGFQAKAA